MTFLIRSVRVVRQWRGTPLEIEAVDRHEAELKALDAVEELQQQVGWEVEIEEKEKAA